jgi:hypothetical protein
VNTPDVKDIKINNSACHQESSGPHSDTEINYEISFKSLLETYTEYYGNTEKENFTLTLDC